MHRINRRRTLPALTDHFAVHAGAPRLHRFGQFVGQIEIATDALRIRTIEAEHGLRAVEVDRVLDLAALVPAFRVVVRQANGQGFQLCERIREARGFFDALALLLSIFRLRTLSFLKHISRFVVVEFQPGTYHKRLPPSFLMFPSPQSLMVMAAGAVALNRSAASLSTLTPKG